MEIREHVDIVSPDLVMEQLLNLLEDAPGVPLRVTGSSMTPFLVPGRDTVYLSKITEPLRRGDLVLYRRRSGRYVLHRILCFDGAFYTTIGDAQCSAEPGICREQILAIVSAVRRKEKLLQKGSFCWFFFEKVWIRLVPIRPFIRNVYTAAKRLQGNKGVI